jgi:hypothetical protein
MGLYSQLNLFDESMLRRNEVVLCGLEIEPDCLLKFAKVSCAVSPSLMHAGREGTYAV